MFVRRKGSSSWCIALTHVDTQGLLLWTTKSGVVHGDTVFRPMTEWPLGSAPYEWGFVDDTNDWEAQRIHWRGDAWRIMTRGTASSSSSSSSSSAPPPSASSWATSGALAVRSDKASTTLLRAAAFEAFKGMGMQALLDLAALHDVSIATGADEFDTAFSKSDEVRDGFGDQDLKHLDSFNEDRRKNTNPNYAKKCEAFRASTLASMKAKSKPLTARASKAFAGKVSDGTRLYPKIQAARTLTIAEAHVFCPEGATISTSGLDNRWRLRLRSWHMSRSWTLYGEVRAFALCAKHIWTCHEGAGGAKCPFSWIASASDE